MSIMVGTGRGAQAGVLIRNAEALEAMESVDTLVVDKTGTLTEGRPRVTSVIALDGSDVDLLRLAASVEQGSEHPLAAAVVAAAHERGVTWPPGAAFESITGKGVRATVDGRRVVLGNATLIKEDGIETRAADSRATELRGGGRTILYVAADGRLSGLIAVEDPVRATTREALEALRSEGLRVVMATGDARATAEAVAASLGFSPGDVRAEVLPGHKRDIVRELQSQGRRVAMAGDGINDAPALAEAHVGIAMGTGTDVAMESAAITLVKGDLRGLVRARRLSRATMRNIRQNLFLAFIYNIVGVPVAAGALYPFVGLLVSPVWASAAMTFSSVSVIANALRLRRLQL
jgi:Cu+-exporting ATPase